MRVVQHRSRSPDPRPGLLVRRVSRRTSVTTYGVLVAGAAVVCHGTLHLGGRDVLQRVLLQQLAGTVGVVLVDVTAAAEHVVLVVLEVAHADSAWSPAIALLIACWSCPTFSTTLAAM